MFLTSAFILFHAIFHTNSSKALHVPRILKGDGVTHVFLQVALLYQSTWAWVLPKEKMCICLMALEVEHPRKVMFAFLEPRSALFAESLMLFCNLATSTDSIKCYWWKNTPRKKKKKCHKVVKTAREYAKEERFGLYHSLLRLAI